MTFADPAPRAYSIDRRWLLTAGAAVVAIVFIAIMSQDKPDLPSDVPGGEGADTNTGEHPPCPDCGVLAGEIHMPWCQFGYVDKLR